MRMTERIYNEDGGWYCAKCGNFHDDYYDASVLKECPKCGENLIETEKMVDREYLLSVGAKCCDEKDYPQWLLNLREQHKKECEGRKENVFCQEKEV